MKIAIASGKGGTGKTTISTNLSVLLSKTESVVLADLDVEEPNSGLFIRGDLKYEEIKYKMIPQWKEDTCTLCGECQKNCNFHAVIQLGPQIMVFPELCHSCFACSELCPTSSLPIIKQRMGVMKLYQFDNLSFIESRLDIGQEQAVPLIGQTNEYVEQNFDGDFIKIFDSPPGTSCPVIEATKEADFVILVTEPTPFGLHDLILAIETMRKMGKVFGVVINRYGSGNNAVVDYCIEEGIDIIGRIPDQRRIAEIYSTGGLIYDKVPEFKLALDEIAQYIRKMDGGN